MLKLHIFAHSLHLPGLTHVSRM